MVDFKKQKSRLQVILSQAIISLHSIRSRLTIANSNELYTYKKLI